MLEVEKKFEDLRADLEIAQGTIRVGDAERLEMQKKFDELKDGGEKQSKEFEELKAENVKLSEEIVALQVEKDEHKKDKKKDEDGNKDKKTKLTEKKLFKEHVPFISDAGGEPEFKSFSFKLKQFLPNEDTYAACFFYCGLRTRRPA